MSEPTDFVRYYRATAGAPPRRTLVAALAAFEAAGCPASDRLAVDLGCGTGRDALHLLQQDWRVLGIDREPAALSGLLAQAERLGAAQRLQVIQADFSEVPLPACDLVNASFALPLCPPARFPALWTRVSASLRPGGRFAGQLYGPRDSWASRPGVTTHGRPELDRLLADWTVELLEEEENDGTTPRGGAKHWHVWHIVARRP